MKHFTRILPRLSLSVWLRRSLWIAALLPVPNYGSADPNEIAQSVWHLASRGLSEEAYARFSRLAKSGGDNRETKFGVAITLLNIQPKTSWNIERAYGLLEDLRDGDSSDETGISAQYFLGRIDQIHRSSPDRKSAGRHYTDLIEQHGEHPLAQLAIIKLGILELYSPSSKDVAAVLFRTEAKAELLTDPIARRDFHILLAEAYERFTQSKSKSLEHLLGAQEADPSIRRLDPDFTLRIADLARELGKYKLAIRSYREFIGSFQRDARRYQVKHAIEALAARMKNGDSPYTEVIRK